MNELAILIEKKVGWTQRLGSVHPLHAEIWRPYCSEPATLKLSTSRTSHEIVRIGKHLLSSNNSLEIRLGKAKTRKRDSWALCGAANTKLAKACTDAGEVVGLPDRQAASDVSV